MSRKGAINPLRLNAGDAEIAATIIEARTAGVDLEDTPFAALPVFCRKLRKALNRRRASNAEIVMWTVERPEAEAGYRYLMLFSHADVPPDFLSSEGIEAVHNVALDIASSLIARKGARGLDAAAIERRLKAWDDPDAPDVDLLDRRWISRLKKRKVREDAFWQEALKAGRSPIPPDFLALLAPPKSTGF